MNTDSLISMRVEAAMGVEQKILSAEDVATLEALVSKYRRLEARRDLNRRIEQDYRDKTAEARDLHELDSSRLNYTKDVIGSLLVGTAVMAPSQYSFDRKHSDEQIKGE